MRHLGIFLVLTLIAVASLLAANESKQPPLALVGTLDLPGISGDMDHLAIDTAGKRLFLAAEDNGTVRVIDLARGSLGQTIKGFNTPHSILFLPWRRELLVTDGSKSVKVLDSDSFTVKKEIPTTAGADSIGVDRANHVMYAVTGGKDVSMTRSAIAAIDTRSETLKIEIPIDGSHVEAMAVEHSGPRLFVNVTDKNYMAVINRTAGKLIAQWPIKEAKQNAPVAFDESGHRLFVVCREPGKLVVVNSETGRSVTSFPTGAKADEVVFDSVHRRIYVAAGEGHVYVYQQVDPDHYTPLTPVPSAVGAKTAVLSPDASRLYVASRPEKEKWEPEC